jgi:hypothetical protein
VRRGTGPEPVQSRLGHNPAEERDAVHQDATEGYQYGVDLRCAWLPAWCGERG